MNLNEKYTLLELLRDEGVKTFAARETATGRPVLVHLFTDSASPLSLALLAKLDALSETERRRILDSGEQDGVPFVITDRLPEYPGFREWLAANAEHSAPQAPSASAKSLDSAGAWQIRPPQPPPSAPILTDTGEQTLKMPAPLPTPADSPAAGAQPQQAGEFTRLFSALPAKPSSAPVQVPPVQVPQRPAPLDPPSSQPGEFTRMFAPPPVKPAAVPTDASASIESPPASQSSVSQPSPAGEFTRMFAARPPESPAAASPPLSEEKPRTSQPGEFTRFMQTQAPVQRPERAVPQSAAPSGPGEFTQMLQAQRPVSPPASPQVPRTPPPAARSSEFTNFFESPASSSLPSNLPLQPPSPPKGAGEFTQIFGKGDLPQPPPSPVIQTPSTVPGPLAGSVQSTGPLQPASGGATQVFASMKPQTPSAAPSVPAQAPVQVPQGPGEYTRMFSAQAPLTFGQSSPTPPQAYQPAPLPPMRKSKLPLILLIGGAILLLAALIVFLAMRSKGT